MRVLLIDNHDSFTYNLAHDLAVVTGTMPDVVPNDAPVPDPRAWLAGYDAIVVSPGPGTPHRDADLGHSLAAVEQGEVPVLGICLGMQAIARAAGVGVVRAPRPVHGEQTLVAHSGTGLFAGLPNPLPMVRYHSLVLDIRPGGQTRGDLAVDAWSDGLAMGVRHPTRPQWGVQTHPESILSRHGRDLIRNFVELARAWNDTGRRGTGEVGGGAAGGGGSSPRGEVRLRSTTPVRRTILARRVATPLTSDVVFDAVFAGDDHAWLLDSPDGTGVSACGSAAGPLAAVATVVAGELRVRDADGTRVVEGDVLDLVEGSLGPVRVEDLDGTGAALADLPFALGWVGYLGYEQACALAGLPAAPPPDEPAAVLVRTDRAVVLRQGTAWVLALAPDSGDAPDTRAQQRGWVERTVALLRERPAAVDHTPPPPAVSGVSVRHERDAYLSVIARCAEQIAAGESYELCLTNRITVHLDQPCPTAPTAHDSDDPRPSWDLYRRLRHLSPRPFAAYLAFDGGHVLSASPERFLSVDRDGIVEARPIKGTRPRGATPAEDDALAAELQTCVKERAENLMIVDLLRHDLSRVCAPDSVHVPLLFDVERHVGVHQLVSTIRGTLTPGATSLDAVRAALPGGSMTGAPKERSVQILRDLEGGPRGVYSGVVGYVSFTGVTDWSIVIRTIVHHADRLTYGVGGAITARSRPAEEWQETLVKARTLGSALGIDLDRVLDEPSAHVAPGADEPGDDDLDGGESA